MSLQTQESPVLLSSKKIKKAGAKSSYSQGAQQRLDSKYTTFNPLEKKAILSSFRQTMTEINLLHPETHNLSLGDLLEFIRGVRTREFNKILTVFLEKHLLSFNLSTRILKQWRRRIRNWTCTFEKLERTKQEKAKHERKKSWLIPEDKLEVFRENLIGEVQKMKNRNIGLLRKKIVTILKKIGRPIDNYICSKHWWYSFLSKNVDIRDLWESLPKKTRRKEEDSEDEEETNEDSPQQKKSETVGSETEEFEDNANFCIKVEAGRFVEEEDKSLIEEEEERKWPVQRKVKSEDFVPIKSEALFKVDKKEHMHLPKVEADHKIQEEENNYKSKMMFEYLAMVKQEQEEETNYQPQPIVQQKMEVVEPSHKMILDNPVPVKFDTIVNPQAYFEMQREEWAPQRQWSLLLNKENFMMQQIQHFQSQSFPAFYYPNLVGSRWNY